MRWGYQTYWKLKLVVVLLFQVISTASLTQLFFLMTIRFQRTKPQSSFILFKAFNPLGNYMINSKPQNDTARLSDDQWKIKPCAKVPTYTTLIGPSYRQTSDILSPAGYILLGSVSESGEGYCTYSEETRRSYPSLDWSSCGGQWSLCLISQDKSSSENAHWWCMKPRSLASRSPFLLLVGHLPLIVGVSCQGRHIVFPSTLLAAFSCSNAWCGHELDFRHRVAIPTRASKHEPGT